MGRNKWMWALLCVVLAGAALSGCGGNGDKMSEGVIAGENADTAADADVIMDESNMAYTDAEKETEMTDVSGTEIVQIESITLSILGDSLSTYEGWIPEECAFFFPRNGALTDVSETWWMQLLNDTGMALCSNNSSSGSTCVGDSLFAGEMKYGCSEDRISLLAGSGGKMPDVVIVFMGTNDLVNGVPLGDNDGTEMVEEGEIDNFSDAYTLILDKISSEYPAAQVYCCGLHQVGDWGTTQPFVIFTNYLGLTAEDYSKQIQTIAGNKGASYIDLYHCGIEVDNLSQTTSDGVHFTPLGMGYVKEAVLHCLTDAENK